MKHFVPFLLIIVLACCCHNAEIPTNPNVLFILVDDLGYSDVGFMGSTYYETPHLDSLAALSSIFMQGYSTSAVCSPSRASIMTGKFVTRHGITDWIGAPEGEAWRSYKRHTKLLPPPYERHLNHEFTTIPEALRNAGYRTFFAGKWHLGGEENGSLPTDHGFEYNVGGYHVGSPSKGRYFSPFSNPYLEDLPEEKGLPLAMKLAKETNQFISSHAGEPFFAFLSFYEVHGPIQTTEEKWSHFREKAVTRGLDSIGFDLERMLPARRNQDNPVYAGLIGQMDDAVGKVLAHLESLGLMEKTIIIFTSDNGGVVSGDNYSTNLAPLRGGKGYQWEGGTRVPYLIYVPWIDAKGKRYQTPVTGADFFPTILDLTGVASPLGDQDGKSLIPVLEGSSIPERPLFWHYPHYGNQGGEPNATIRRGDWKLIHYYEDGREELYHLNDDLSERNDLSETQLEKREALASELMDWLKATRAAMPEADPLYEADSNRIVLNNFRIVVKERLESGRRQMLAPDFQPNEDWWGSKVKD